MPTYQPDKLNRNAEYGSLVTCYGYAVLDIKFKELQVLAVMARQAEAAGGKWGGPQPGMLAQHRNTTLQFPPTSWATDLPVKGAHDGMIPFNEAGVPPVRKGFHAIAVFTERPDGGATHLLRRDDQAKGKTGTTASSWSHKFDFNPVTNRDDAGQPIPADPRQAQWQKCPVFQGFYYAPSHRQHFRLQAAHAGAKRPRRHDKLVSPQPLAASGNAKLDAVMRRMRSRMDSTNPAGAATIATKKAKQSRNAL